MIPLSVAIITFNEEKNVGRCIDSVKNIADDIVVVDSFSTDKTRNICLEKGVRFLTHKFEGHIEQKNYAITQTIYPHVLSLDADEALDDTLKASIIEVKKNWKSDGYEINRLTNYCGKWIHHCGWYPDTKLRLWDSRKGAWGGVNPHDKFIMGDLTATTTFLEGNILHYSYYTIEEHLHQADKFSAIAANALFKKGDKANYILILTKTIAKFIRNYIFKLGFLEGYYGLVICSITAKETFMKYNKLRKLKIGKSN